MDRQCRPLTDPVSGEYYASLSLAVRYFYPDTDIYRMSDKNNFNRLSYQNMELIHTGSTTEELNLPLLRDIVNCQDKHDTDVDMMTWVKYSEVVPHDCDLYLESENVRPGYCHLVLISDYNKVNVCLKTDLDTSDMGKCLMLDEDCDVSESSSGNDEDTCEVDDHSSTSDNPFDLEQCLYRRDELVYIKNDLFVKMLFPLFEKQYKTNALEHSVDVELKQNLEQTGPSPAFKLLFGSVPHDQVPCFAVPWPKAAKTWGSRKREHGWPTPATIKSALGSSCFLVSKPHPLSTYPDIDWRYSFSMAEIILAKSLNHMQRVCYKVFKSLIKYNPKTRDFDIQTYFLKTTLFWACEESAASSWDLDGLGEKFLYLLDKLLEFLRRHELPHYFIPNSNLIEHIPQDEVQKWISGIEFIRNDPLQCIHDFHSEYQVDFHAIPPFYQSANIRHFYQTGLEILREKPVTLDELASKVHEFLHLLGFGYAILCSNEMVLSIAKTELCIGKHSKETLRCGQEQDCVNDELNILLRSYLYYKELVPKFIRLLDDRDTERRISIDILQTLISTIFQAEIACIYFQMSQTGNPSKHVKDKLCNRAEQYFRNGYSHEPSAYNVQLQVKYAQFLVVQGRYREAFILLYDNLATIEETLLFVTYNRYTDQSVEATLRKIFTFEGGDIMYRVDTLTNFLLVVCRKEIFGYTKEIREDYCQFQERVQNPAYWKIHFHTDPMLLDACVLLRYGNIHKALCVLMKSKYRFVNHFYKWYCVSLMVNMLSESDLFPLLLTFRIGNFLNKISLMRGTDQEPLLITIQDDRQNT